MVKWFSKNNRLTTNVSALNSQNESLISKKGFSCFPRMAFSPAQANIPNFLPRSPTIIYPLQAPVISGQDIRKTRFVFWFFRESFNVFLAPVVHKLLSSGLNVSAGVHYSLDRVIRCLNNWGVLQFCECWIVRLFCPFDLIDLVGAER